ncbi:MAG: DUF4339 domain-containing protein [Candidatus Aureabacteria bacterium]|nr:DUF4339 domain-containing protein [Candidatus Auribacterota bacterium]
MISLWEYKIDEKEHGPYGANTIENLLKDGTLNGDSLIKGKSTGDEWVKISETPEFSGSAEVTKEAKQSDKEKPSEKKEKIKCPKCKHKFDPDTADKGKVELKLSYVCPKCKVPFIPGEKSNKKNKIEWRLCRSDVFGTMYGPIPIAWIMVTIIIVVLYMYFWDDFIGQIKKL